MQRYAVHVRLGSQFATVIVESENVLRAIEECRNLEVLDAEETELEVSVPCLLGHADHDHLNEALEKLKSITPGKLLRMAIHAVRLEPSLEEPMLLTVYRA